MKRVSRMGVARTEDLELQGAVVPHAARVLRGVVVRVPLLPVARAVLQEERVDERLQRPARPEDRVVNKLEAGDPEVLGLGRSAVRDQRRSAPR